ncbi:hypothetical protein JCM8547_005575 [Rhodosporidiobolus lusitaniae]
MFSASGVPATPRGTFLVSRLFRLPTPVVPHPTTPANSIEAQLDVNTTDGYLVRLFTKKRPNQVKKTTYAQSAQVREIRKKMFEIMQREAGSCDLKQLVHKLVPEVIGREIEKASQSINPL